ncbi:hypothetical protein C8R44DRAFT_788344 [Mycena epipterygia]|nr:hypothetical protein C8R44DRAFT_788344 [Mycena epipterygia]
MLTVSLFSKRTACSKANTTSLACIPSVGHPPLRLLHDQVSSSIRIASESAVSCCLIVDARTLVRSRTAFQY